VRSQGEQTDAEMRAEHPVPMGVIEALRDTLERDAILTTTALSSTGRPSLSGLHTPFLSHPLGLWDAGHGAAIRHRRRGSRSGASGGRHRR
jgi:hypothetical protein